MKLYSAKVRLYGEVKDEVQRVNVTAAEVRVLRSIHGEDAVVSVEPTGNVDRSDSQERDRLSRVYGEKVIAKMFGVPVAEISTELPTDLELANAALPVVEPGKRKSRSAPEAADAIME